MARQPNPPGSRKKLTNRKMIALFDRETGELLANVRLRPRAVLYVESVAPHVASRVVSDLTPPPAAG